MTDNVLSIPSDGRPIWERLIDVAHALPEEALARLPGKPDQVGGSSEKIAEAAARECLRLVTPPMDTHIETREKAASIIAKHYAPVVEESQATRESLEDLGRAEGEELADFVRRVNADRSNLRSDFECLKAENERLNAVLDSRSAGLCIWCKSEFKKGDIEAFRAHIKECNAHPLHPLVQENERLRGEVSILQSKNEELRKAVARLTDAAMVSNNDAQAYCNEAEELKLRLAKVEEAARAMLDLEALRMFERSMEGDAKVQPCPCPGCRRLRSALGGEVQK